MVPNRHEILIDALRRPEAFPHPVGAIDIRQTHISWIILAGEFAYKIKKPVRFDFLDFSTLERRRHFCQEELRLNRRYALELYLDVVPISGPPDRPRVDDDSDPIEYAVKMVQFPAGALLSEMIAEHRLLAEHVDELALRIAEFHASADRRPPAPSESGAPPLGSAAVVRRNAEENLAVLRGDLPAQDRQTIQNLWDWTEAAFARLHDRFEERLRDGFVRECHGDLHLANLIHWRGRVMPFDGIEFNDRFRWIDVLSDAAFVTMDLEDRGRPDLAHRFTNAYLQHTGDYFGLEVWRWYLVYRALVRAKVAMLRRDQQQAQDGEQSLIEVMKYVNQANRFAIATRPELMITHGLSGSGKTYGTQTLLERTGAIRIRSDVERKRLFGYGETERSSSGTGEGIYTADASERTYRRLYECSEAILRAGHGVIVDAAFLKRAQREPFRELALRLNVDFKILAFTADAATLRQRLIARAKGGQDASEADLTVLEHQLAMIEPLEE